MWVIVEVAVGTRGKEIGRGQNAAVIQWPKALQCMFCFTHMCWSCTSPGALCFWVVPYRSPGRCCKDRQLSPQSRTCRGCSQSRQRHCWCQAGGGGQQQGSACSPIQWALHQGWCCSWRLWNPVPLERAVYSGLTEEETLFLCSKNVEDVNDFSSDKFQQSTSVVLKTCQIFHTLLTNAFEEYHTQANFSVTNFTWVQERNLGAREGNKVFIFVFWALHSISTVPCDWKCLWRPRVPDQWDCAGKAGLQPCAGASQSSVPLLLVGV